MRLSYAVILRDRGLRKFTLVDRIPSYTAARDLARRFSSTLKGVRPVPDSFTIRKKKGDRPVIRSRVDKYIETEWNGIPHFYYNFYVYQYSTGIAAATMLAKMVREGGSKEKEKYLDFLKSGCSKYPLDTLKAAGVDLTGPGPVQTAVDTFNDIVSRMEAILETSDLK
jgi:hypothetical protein